MAADAEPVGFQCHSLRPGCGQNVGQGHHRDVRTAAAAAAYSEDSRAGLMGSCVCVCACVCVVFVSARVCVCACACVFE